jgi:Inner membrane component domain
MSNPAGYPPGGQPPPPPGWPQPPTPPPGWQQQPPPPPGWQQPPTPPPGWQQQPPPPPGWQQPPQGWQGPPPGVNVNVQAPVMVVAAPKGPGIGVRAIWFLFIGWWLAGLVITVAYICAVTIIGLPFAFYLFNRIPTAMTLRGRSQNYQATTSADGSTTYLNAVNVPQRPMWQRAIWFILIGWWFGAIWMGIAYVLCLLAYFFCWLILPLALLPIGLMMFDRTGGIMTLLRN